MAGVAEAREGTAARGVRELASGEVLLGRVRRPGGGRKRAEVTDPGLRSALLALIEPEERGDPMSPLRWTISMAELAARLQVSEATVRCYRPAPAPRTSPNGAGTPGELEPMEVVTPG